MQTLSFFSFHFKITYIFSFSKIFRKKFEVNNFGLQIIIHNDRVFSSI